MTEKNDFKLDVVSIRLVKEAPIYSEQSFNKPEEVAVRHQQSIFLTQPVRDRLDILCPVPFFVTVLFTVHKTHAVKYDMGMNMGCIIVYHKHRFV